MSKRQTREDAIRHALRYRDGWREARAEVERLRTEVAESTRHVMRDAILKSKLRTELRERAEALDSHVAELNRSDDERTCGTCDRWSYVFGCAAARHHMHVTDAEFSVSDVEFQTDDDWHCADWTKKGGE